MGPLSYMRSVVNRNVMRCIPVYVNFPTSNFFWKTQGQVSLWKKNLYLRIILILIT